MEPHDILAECAKVSLDSLEGTTESLDLPFSKKSRSCIDQLYMGRFEGMCNVGEVAQENIFFIRHITIRKDRLLLSGVK